MTNQHFRIRMMHYSTGTDTVAFLWQDGATVSSIHLNSNESRFGAETLFDVRLEQFTEMMQATGFEGDFIVADPVELA